MAKKDQIAAIKAANGAELMEANYSGKQLEELETLAKSGATDRTAFDAKVAEFDQAREAANQAPSPAPSTTPAAKVSGEKMIAVKVSARVAAIDGEFTDPDSKRTIGKEAVSVPHTAFVKEKLRSEEIVEAE